MSTSPRMRYDAAVDALYLTLADGTVTESIEVEESVYIDVAADGRPLGIEFVSAAELVPFLQRHGGEFVIPAHVEALVGAAPA